MTRALYRYFESIHGIVSNIRKDNSPLGGITDNKGVNRLLDEIVKYVDETGFQLKLRKSSDSDLNIMLVKKSFPEIDINHALKVYNTLDYIFDKMRIFIETSKIGFEQYKQASTIKMSYDSVFSQNFDIILLLIIYMQLPRELNDIIKPKIGIDETIFSNISLFCKDKLIVQDQICTIKGKSDKMSNLTTKDGILGLLVLLNAIRPFSQRRSSLL